MATTAASLLAPLFLTSATLSDGKEDAPVINPPDVFFSHLTVLGPLHDVRRQPFGRREILYGVLPTTSIVYLLCVCIKTAFQALLSFP